MEFNFEATHIDTLCGITEKRGHELASILADVAFEIEQNFIEYSFTPHHDPKGIGMHKGKVMKRFLQAVPDPKEQLFVVILFDTLTSVMAEQAKKRRIMEALSGGIKSFFEKLSGKEQPNTAQ